MYTSMFRKAMLGDTATLNLDFTTTGVLDSRLTFTRASTATYINSSGYVTTMGAAPTNDPTKARFDYDPVTLAPRGLLIEGSAINYINWSESFETTGGAVNWNWSALNVTRGTVTTTAPTGSSETVVKIQETNANGVHTPLTQPATNASTVYTFSVFAKAAERTFVQLLENNGSSGSCMVNLSTGAIVSEFFAGSATVTPYGTTGWYRISLKFTTIVSQTSANCHIRLSTDGTTTSYTGTTGSGIYIWGAQLELGSGASSYIPTAASQVTRNADGVVMNDISSLGYSTQVGSIYWSGIINKQPIAYSTLIGFMTAGDQPTFETFGNALNYFSAARGSGLSAGGPNEVARPYTLGSNIRYASSVNTLVNPIVQVDLNGSANSTTKTGTGDMYLATRFVIGRGASYVLNYPSVTIKQIRYYPEFKTAAQLQALTAP